MPSVWDHELSKSSRYLLPLYRPVSLEWLSRWSWTETKWPRTVLTVGKSGLLLRSSMRWIFVQFRKYLTCIIQNKIKFQQDQKLWTSCAKGLRVVPGFKTILQKNSEFQKFGLNIWSWQMTSLFTLSEFYFGNTYINL